MASPVAETPSPRCDNQEGPSRTSPRGLTQGCVNGEANSVGYPWGSLGGCVLRPRRNRFCHLLQRPCLLLLLSFHTVSQAQRRCLRRAWGQGGAHWTLPLAGLHWFSCSALFIPPELSRCSCCHGNWSQGRGRGTGLWRWRKTCRIWNFSASKGEHTWLQRCLSTP